MTPGATGLTLSVSQNKYLTTGARDVDALLSITAAGLGTATAPGAEVILVDCSGSMGMPETKIAAARRATMAAIGAVPDGFSFAIVQGTEQAAMVYPRQQRLAVATPDTRAAARQAVRSLVPAGGTAMGRWLALARDLLDRHPAGVRHALLLTDGKNEHEQQRELTAVLARCAERFTCDARAIGAGWEPRELLRIVGALRGGADEVRLDELEDDFRTMITESTGRVIADLRLVVRTMDGVGIRFLRQVHPTAVDLSADAVRVGAREVEFSTGSWGDGTAEYHLRLDVDPGRFDRATDNQMALLRIRPAGAPGGPPDAGVFAHWTQDTNLSTWLEPGLSHYGEQAELGEKVNAGCAVRRTDPAAALVLWGEAVKLAYETGNDRILRRLDDVVVVIDAAAGEVRMRPELRPGAVAALELSSVASSANPYGPSRVDRTAPSDPGEPARSRPDRRCPRCGRLAPDVANFCEPCGAALGGPV